MKFLRYFSMNQCRESCYGKVSVCHLFSFLWMRIMSLLDIVTCFQPNHSTIGAVFTGNVSSSRFSLARRVKKKVYLLRFDSSLCTFALCSVIEFEFSSSSSCLFFSDEKICLYILYIARMRSFAMSLS